MKAVTLIVGAGMAGLTAAYQLAVEGERCILVERGEKVGGLCQSLELDGIKFDLGPHVFFHNPNAPSGRLLYDVLKNQETVTGKFRFAIEARGRYWKLPVDVWEILKYPLHYKLELARAYLGWGGEPDADPRSLRYFLEKQSGASFYQDIFGPLSLKKTNIAGEHVHLDWQTRADRTIHNRKEPPFPVKSNRWQRVRQLLLGDYRYIYPVQGYEQFARGIWDRYGQAGGETVLSCGVIAFEKEGDHIVSASVGGRSFPVKNVIWTGSVNELNKLLWQGIKPVKYVDMLIMHITYDVVQQTERKFVYTYHLQPDFIFNRIYYPYSLLKGRLPSDREGICLEINDFGNLDSMTEDEIVSRALDDIERLGLFSKCDVREYRLTLLKEAMPVYDLDYESQLEETFKEINGYDNLYAVGRRGGYFFCLTPAATNQGLKIANHLLNREKGYVHI